MSRRPKSIAGWGAGLMMTLALGTTAEPVLLPVANDPTVSISIWFKVGSQNDPPGKEGLALLTSSLLAEGATAKRSYQEILAALYPLAATYGARTDQEMTTFSGRAHKDTLDAYLELYTQAFLEPKFDAADFERLRSSQKNDLERTLRYSSDEDLAKAVLHSALFAGSRYAHPPLGTVAGLSAITLDDVRAFYRQHYTRDNAVLALGGGFSTELRTRLEAALARLPAGAPAALPPPAFANLDGRELTLVSKPGADASISFGFPISVRRGERDFYALWLANSWLGEHRNTSSHLYQVIREARGMNYGDYSYIEAFPEGGRRQMPPVNVARNRQFFEVWIRTLPNQQAHFALRAALRELETLIEQGMSQEDFELTRSFLSKYALHFAETTSARLGYAVDDRFYGIAAPGHLTRFREAMASLTRDEVNAALKRHLSTAKLEIAIVTGEAEGLKKALLAEAPSPMTYESEKPAAITAEDKIIAVYPLRLNPEKVQIIPVDQIFP